MKRYFILIVTAFTLLYFSCDDKEDDYKSVAGEWVVEDNGEMTAYRRYDVGVERVHADTTQFTISNFYKIGNGNQVRIEVRGLQVLIRAQLVGNYHFEGRGRVNSNYHEINLEYEVYSPEGYEKVTSLMKRP